MVPFKKYVTCIKAFFTPSNFVALCQFYCTTSPVSFTKLHQEIKEWEEKGFMRKPEGKIELQKKVHRGIYLRDITFVTARYPFYAFLLLSSSIPFPFPNHALAQCLLATYIATGGMLCDDIMSKWSKIWNYKYSIICIL